MAEDAEPKKTALTQCVARMKAQGLTGKLRDDAAGHFLAGVKAAGVEIIVDEPVKYVDVLEALAES